MRGSSCLSATTSNRGHWDELLVRWLQCRVLEVLGMTLVQVLGIRGLVLPHDLAADEGHRYAAAVLAVAVGLVAVVDPAADYDLGSDLGPGLNLGCVVDHGFHGFRHLQIAVACHHRCHRFR